MPRPHQISHEDVPGRAAALYHRYDDKDGAFCVALEHYAEQTLAPRLGRLAGAARPSAAIAAFFDDIVAASADDPDRLGCLLVSTSLDGGPMSETARAAAASRLAAIEAAFRQTLDRAAPAILTAN